MPASLPSVSNKTLGFWLVMRSVSGCELSGAQFRDRQQAVDAVLRFSLATCAPVMPTSSGDLLGAGIGGFQLILTRSIIMPGAARLPGRRCRKPGRSGRRVRTRRSAPASSPLGRSSWPCAKVVIGGFEPDAPEFQPVGGIGRVGIHGLLAQDQGLVPVLLAFGDLRFAQQPVAFAGRPAAATSGRPGRTPSAQHRIARRSRH